MSVFAKSYIIMLVAAGMLFSIQCAHAGWLDWLKKPGSSNTPPGQAGAATNELTQDEMLRGLREALGNGAQHAVRELGKPDGFFKNLEVRIPMPSSLATVEKTLRTFKQDQMADDFVLTMNRAAERAVTEAAPIFGEAIGQMTLSDARQILTGPPDAATQFFRKTSEEKLRIKFRPVVARATEQTGVTSAYKAMLQRAGPATQFLGEEARDIDGYVTQKSLDGLFKMIADEEKRIRENPVARTTDLLRRVFGATAAKPGG